MNYNSLKSSKLVKNLILLIKRASPIEKLLFAAILFFFFIATLLLIERVSDSFSVQIPIQGGTLKEGIVGFPVSVSPITAVSNAEHDLVALTYSGLMKVDGEGNLVPDLAESVTVSEDGLEYTFKLRTDAFFHDGTPITASDVVFTVESTKNPAMESPLASAFSEVEVVATDPSTVVFTLEDPYGGFLAETTLGIMPMHVWQGVTPDSLRFIELSSFPVGSGPYKVDRVERSESLGVPTNYLLSAFGDYPGKGPYINAIDLTFYADETELVQAIRRGDVDAGASLSPSSVESVTGRKRDLKRISMQRVFGLYFNPSESSPLADPDVRKAMDAAIDRDMLAESVFSGYAKSTRTPLPFDNSEIDPEEPSDPRELLEDAGWEVNSATGIREKDGEPLAFTIKTGELEELASTASYIEATLRSLGFDVTVETFDIATLNETVIRGRDYDALLFGQAYGRFIDLYPFWHSSNRNDPGLNIARYTSSSMDEKLVGLRRATEEEEREEYLSEIVEEIRETVPAVFLYVPDFLYITDERIKNIKIPPVERSSNRFSNVEDWFMYTDTVWKIFLKDQ